MMSKIKTKMTQQAVKERDKYLSRTGPSTQKGDEVVQAAAATVGFVSEIVHYRKEKKTTTADKAAGTDNATPPATNANASHSVASREESPNAAPTPKDLALAFLACHPSPPTTSPPSPSPPTLPLPILLPQRRPTTRTRGFTPAYAPILSSFSIPRPAFLSFILSLNASLEPNPYLAAINLAGFVGEASPEPVVSVLVGLGVEVVTDAIMQAQSRARSNAFLERVNEGFFKPRGLFAFVGSWEPGGEGECVVNVREGEGDGEGVARPRFDLARTGKGVVVGGELAARAAWADLNQQVRRAIAPSGGGVVTMRSAELIWPSADEVAEATPVGLRARKDRFDRAGVWVDGHVDRHTQARWVQEHPEYVLADKLPKPEFRSRYADPGHAASSGDVVALLTGGEWQVKEDEKKREKEVRRQEKKREKKVREEAKRQERRNKKELEKEEKARRRMEKGKAREEGDKDDEERVVRDGEKERAQPDMGEVGVVGSDRRELCETTPQKQSTQQAERTSEGKGEKKKQPSNGFSSLLRDVSIDYVTFWVSQLTSDPGSLVSRYCPASYGGTGSRIIC